MQRTVKLSNTYNPDTLHVTFKENKKPIGSFIFWNYHKYAEVLARKTADFINYGILPTEENGFICL